MRLASRIAAVTLASVLGIAACEQPLCGCSPPVAVGIVYGVITDENGPIAEAEVYTPSVVPGSWEGCEEVVGFSNTTTDSTGYYRLMLAGSDETEHCFRLFVRLTPGNPGQEITPEPLRLTFRFHDPPDSLRYDTTLTNPSRD